jgi:protoporphyrinogen IX oxidase
VYADEQTLDKGRMPTGLHASLPVSTAPPCAMPWLKLLHITAVIVWCGALLYLPVWVASAARGGMVAPPVQEPLVPVRLLRPLFTWVATPAALIAIASGTFIFVWHEVLAVWLMAKLGLVGLLVLGHGACGLLVLRVEAGRWRGTRLSAQLIVWSSLLWLAAIAWLVLRKPI